MRPVRAILSIYSLGSRLVCRLRRWVYARGLRHAGRAPLAVIGVGNITLGGSGKTPLAVELLRFLQGEGRRPALVSRGYKGAWEKSGGVASDGRSGPAGAAEAGDEPAMVARAVPGAGVYVGRDRLASCRKAAADGFDVAVLDDGFQHLRLARDLDIVLHGPSRGRVLREGPSALRRADIILSEGPAAAVKGIGAVPGPLVFSYGVSARGLVPFGGGPRTDPARAKEAAFLAFCGIARPERFFALLESLGLKPAARLAFPDHFSYPDKALDLIAAKAAAAGCRRLVATEKDAVKLGARLESKTGLSAAYLEIGLDLPEAFFAAVRDRLEWARSGGR
jgi:tetraacyldisaccharide 4'-kinase